MKASHPPINHADERGEIIDIVTEGQVDYVTLIVSREGAVRGNHYHEETEQSVYVLDGRIKLLSRMPGEAVVATILEKGDFALTVAMEEHAMIALEDSSFMVFTRGVRGGVDYEKDTYRLTEPLQG